MSFARSIAVLGLLGAASAQQRTEVHDLGDLPQRLATDRVQGKDLLGPIDRFAYVAYLLLQAEGGNPRSQVAVAAKVNCLILRGSADEIVLVKGMLEQLRGPHLQRARLQCSFLTMPVALLKAHGLTTNTFVPTDETAFGKIVRDAVKEKGALQNLPEVIVEPLVPFVVDPAVKAGKSAPAADQALRLRGEMTPVRSGEVAFAMQLLRGRIADDRTQMLKDAVVNRAFRLGAGKAVMIVTVVGEQATAVFVRCIEVASDAPKEAKDGR